MEVEWKWLTSKHRRNQQSTSRACSTFWVDFRLPPALPGPGGSFLLPPGSGLDFLQAQHKKLSRNSTWCRTRFGSSAITVTKQDVNLLGTCQGVQQPPLTPFMQPGRVLCVILAQHPGFDFVDRSNSAPKCRSKSASKCLCNNWGIKVPPFSLGEFYHKVILSSLLEAPPQVLQVQAVSCAIFVNWRWVSSAFVFWDSTKSIEKPELIRNMTSATTSPVIWNELKLLRHLSKV